MPSSTTQYHYAVEWILESWSDYDQRWNQFGGWNVSYDFQLGRLLAYKEYMHERPYMNQYQLRLRSNEGDIIPMELFQC